MNKNEKAAMGGELRAVMAELHMRMLMNPKDQESHALLVFKINGAQHVFRAGLRYSMDDAEINAYFKQLAVWAQEDAQRKYEEEQENGQ